MIAALRGKLPLGRSLTAHNADQGEVTPVKVTSSGVASVIAALRGKLRPRARDRRPAGFATDLAAGNPAGRRSPGLVSLARAVHAAAASPEHDRRFARETAAGAVADRAYRRSR